MADRPAPRPVTARRPMNDFHTARMHDLVDGLRRGDGRARDDLVRAVADRLEPLARKMLGRFPSVARWEQTGDVVQNALMRLLRALDQVRPESTRGFFALAAEQIRRELLDLARHYQGAHGLGAHHVSTAGTTATPEPAAAEPPRDELDRWAAFHEAVERLPAEEREVIGLVFYHGWTQAQIAELFAVDERTVRRRWVPAGRKLTDALGGDIPDA